MLTLFSNTVILTFGEKNNLFSGAIVNPIVDIVKHKPYYSLNLFKSVTFIKQKTEFGAFLSQFVNDFL